MRLPFENRKKATNVTGIQSEAAAMEDANKLPDTEELCRNWMRRQVEIWQIDTEMQEVLYRKADLDRRN